MHSLSLCHFLFFFFLQLPFWFPLLASVCSSVFMSKLWHVIPAQINCPDKLLKTYLFWELCTFKFAVCWYDMFHSSDYYYRLWMHALDLEIRTCVYVVCLNKPSGYWMSNASTHFYFDFKEFESSKHSAHTDYWPCLLFALAISREHSDASFH